MANINFWKKKNILTCDVVLSEKKILSETKNNTPPLQVKWSVPKANRLVLQCIKKV